MFVVQGDVAVNIDHCEVIEVKDNEIVAEMTGDILGFYFQQARGHVLTTPIATFDTEEQAKKYLALILKAYAHGDKVFYC